MKIVNIIEAGLIIGISYGALNSYGEELQTRQNQSEIISSYSNANDQWNKSATAEDIWKQVSSDDRQRWQRLSVQATRAETRRNVFFWAFAAISWIALYRRQPRIPDDKRDDAFYNPVLSR